MKTAVRLFSAALLAFLALGSSCFDPDDHSPTSPAVQSAITVVASATTLPADGVSTVVITGTIDPVARAANPKLVFKTTRGEFVEAAADATDKTEVERQVGLDGSTTATLRSSRQVGPAEVTVSVANRDSVFARVTVDFVASDPSDTIGLVAAAASAPADGATLTALTATLDEGIAAGTEVQFKTTRGTFVDNGMKTTTQPAGADRRARADLESPVEPGRARLTAEVDGVTAQLFFDFNHALPDTILVTSDRSLLEASNETAGKSQVTVTLLRDVGEVSDTTPVQVRVVAQDDGAEIPARLEGLGPTDGGSTTFTLIVGPVTFRGLANIEARVDGAGAVGTALIEIVAPAT